MPQPKKDDHLFPLARSGAEHRYQELTGELAALTKLVVFSDPADVCQARA